MTDYLIVSTTAGSEEDAQRIARRVVEERLAACAQVLGPISSTYWWEGKIDSSREWLCLLKTSQSQFAALETAIRSVHPYATPEIVATPIVAGSAGYLAWLGQELRPPEPRL